MPIENVSNKVRMPRLGKIHLGIKSTTTKGGHPVEYPKATDYFVCPDEVKEIYGEQPKELDIMIPSEDPELFAPQYLKAYSMSQGLICRGNGVTAQRKIDLKTGALVDSSTESWDWREVSCDPQECDLYMKKSCRQVMNLLFLLPKVPGLGVYQVDTSSYHSIVNVNSMIRLLKGIVGRCSMIPLTLVLRPQEVTPQGTTKKTVHVMDIRQDVTLANLAQQALLPPAKVLMPEVTEDIPEDLYPTKVLEEGKSPEPTAPETPPVEKPATEKPARKKAKPKAKDAEEPASKSNTIERIEAEAKNIGPDFYENILMARVKMTFDKDSLADLAEHQLETVRDWIEGKPSEEDRRAFLLTMKELGFTTGPAVQEQLIKQTGKERGWTRGEITKTILAIRKEKAAAPQEIAGDPEIDDFLRSVE